MIKYLENKNESRILYEQIFEDTKEFIEYYYQERMPQNKVLAYYHEQDLVSVLHRIPHELGINGLLEDVDYIYAVATKPEYRGRGIMARLMQCALRDMAQKKMFFTYLIPEEPKVYISHGFAFVYKSTVKNVIQQNNCNVSGYCIRSAIVSDFEQLILCSDNWLKEKKSVYLKRDVVYYTHIKSQLEVENGAIELFYKDKELKGYCYYSNEGKPQVTELVCDSSESEIFLTLLFQKFNIQQLQISGILNSWKDCEEKERIMARILDVKKIEKYLTPIQAFKINIKVLDPIIEQNNRVFQWEGNSSGCRIRITQEDPCITIGIAELTQWVFGYKEIKEMPLMKRLSGVFVNDVL